MPQPTKLHAILTAVKATRTEGHRLYKSGVTNDSHAHGEDLQTL